MNRRQDDPSDLVAREAELIQLAQHGNVEAFGDLYEIHFDAVFRYLFYRVKNRQRAEDLTETVFIKAWEALPAYEHRKLTLLAWLYRIARNALVDDIRRQSVTHVDLDSQFDLATQASTPEELAGISTEMQRVLAALSQLPPEQQDVIALRFLVGLNHTETAAVMDRSAGSVRVLQHRALAALRNWLK